MSEKMPSPEQLSKIQEENMSDEQIKQSEEREAGTKVPYQPSVNEIYKAQKLMTGNQSMETMAREREFYVETTPLFREEYAEIKEKTKDMFEWSGNDNSRLADVGSMMIHMTDQDLIVKDKRSGETFNVIVDNSVRGGSTFHAGERVIRAILAVDGDTKQMTAKLGDVDYLKTWVQKVLFERSEKK